MSLISDQTQMEMCAVILARTHPDYLLWPEERRSEAFQALLNDALSIGLNQIVGTLKMLDDMVRNEAIKDEMH